MNILVFNPSATSGGGKSIITEKYRELRSAVDNNKYVFITGNIGLQSYGNIQVQTYEWVKKSWFHRLFFDIFVAHRIVRNMQIDEILTYQNMLIPFTSKPQTMYLQQSLPFTSVRIPLRKDALVWLYQNVIGLVVVNSAKRADHIIVQTEWMRKVCVREYGISPEKITVIPPSVLVPEQYRYNTNTKTVTFFYPASALYYKNHQVIVEACHILQTYGITDYRVKFTLSGNESKLSASMKEEIEKSDLPINFIGAISREQVFSILCESCLIFPSMIETYGLPLAEARQIGCLIFAGNTEFSHELLQGYNRVKYFDVSDSVKLAEHMKKMICEQRGGNRNA